MEEYRKYILALRKCAIEHDNDETSFAHIVVSDLCRDTANLLEKLEQEPTFDKIREEIGKAWHTKPKNRYEEGLKDQALKDMQIIDKYKAGSEVKE